MAFKAPFMYWDCQKLIEKGEYKDFADKFSIFNQHSNDNEFQRILIINLVEKLKDKCNDIKNELDRIDIKKFDSERICSLNNNYTKIKLAFDHCRDLIPEDDLSKEKALIETELSKTVRKFFFSFIKSKNAEFKFCEKFWENLNSLIGIKVVDEINNEVLNILEELNLDQQLAGNITDSILHKGMSEALIESQDDIPPKDYEKFKEKIIHIFHQSSNEYISDVLNELRIAENDGLHQRIIDSVLSEGVNSINRFRESISKNNLSKLIQKLKIYFPNTPAYNCEVTDTKRTKIPEAQLYMRVTRR